MSLHAGNAFPSSVEFTDLVRFFQESGSVPEPVRSDAKLPPIAQKASRATAHLRQLPASGPLQKSPESLDLVRLGLSESDPLSGHLYGQTKIPSIPQTTSDVVAPAPRNRTSQKDRY